MLEKRYRDRAEPAFLTELYANLGHAAQRYSDMHKAAHYREQSLEWVLHLDDKQQESVAYGNLAYTYQLMQQCDKGAHLYEKAREAAKEAGDVNLLAIHSVRLGECLVKLKRGADAEKILKDVDSSLLAPHHLAILENLLEQLED